MAEEYQKVLRVMGEAFYDVGLLIRRSGNRRFAIEGYLFFGPLVAMGWLISLPLYLGVLCGEWTNWHRWQSKNCTWNSDDEISCPVTLCTGLVMFAMLVVVFMVTFANPPVSGQILATGLLSIFIGIASVTVMALRMDESYKHREGDDAPTEVLRDAWRLRPIKTLFAKLYWIALGPVMTWLLAGYIIGLIVG